MLASTPEQARGLNLKVANALFVVVQQTVAEFINYLLVGLFQSLQNMEQSNQIDQYSAGFYIQ